MARPLPPPEPRRRLLVLAVLVCVFAGVIVVAGVTLIKRIESGRWQLPHAADFVRVVKGRPRPASKTIFLEGGPVTITPGVDSAARGISSVLARAKGKAVKLPGWKGSAASWSEVVACVRGMFAPFDVQVTDERPFHQDFVLVAVGGKPGDIGVKDKRVAGLAPFDGDVIPTPVVFAFSAALAHDVRATCETIAMEVAHVCGLDHAYECKDVMTYLRGCGAKKFVDKAVRCGEKDVRPCAGGKATQNSYRHLVDVLGARD
ncbi:MAG TPA: hypothetical protein VK427_08545 [Kofleriaceae bacterium]|nr:hypothetical protein [Kofleriaceae bacterium]